MFTFNRRVVVVGFGAVALTISMSAIAQKKYDTGASDTEIKIGNIVPYSGPVSAYGTIGNSAAAYIAKVNAEGGVNGRKINFISADDAYNPSRTVEVTRKLVEQDEVLAVFFAIGTAHNLAIQKYMNTRKVPQLFVGTGATQFGNTKENPWTIGWQPTYLAEGRAFAQHILQSKPTAKVAVLMQNDDFGKDLLKGLMVGFGDKGTGTVVSQQTYETISDQLHVSYEFKVCLKGVEDQKNL